jgi:hypothetical protein
MDSGLLVGAIVTLRLGRTYPGRYSSSGGACRWRVGHNPPRRSLTKVAVRFGTALVALVVAGAAWANGATRAEAQAQIAAAVNHAKKVGTEQATKDINAAPEWKVKGMVSNANKGEGWVDYQFINPESKKLEERAMFVRKVPGTETFVGVAVTK